MVKLKNNLLTRIIESFCIFLLFVFLLTSFFRPVSAINQDLGRHILLGNIILDTLSIPTVNLLTYTNYNFPFVNSHWGSEVIFASVHHLGGYNLLIVVALCLGLLACVPQFFYVYRRFGFLPVAVVSFAYLVIVTVRSDVRPELFSAVFTSWFILILYGKNKRLLYFLPLIEIFWTNLHIYFFAGPVLIFIFLIAEFLESRKIERPLVYVFFLTCIAMFVSPLGVRGAIFPLTVLGNYGFPVGENQSYPVLFTLVSRESFIYPIVLIFSLLLLEAINFRKVRVVDVLLSLVFSVAALLVFRNILLFAFATFIPFTSALDLTITRLVAKFRRIDLSLVAPFFWLSFVGVVVATITQGVIVRSAGFGMQESYKPAVDFIKNAHVDGAIFNTFNVGGYLTYRLYPQLIYIDNRPEAHSVAFVKNYLAMDQDYSRFEKEDEKYNFNVVLITFEEEQYKRSLLASILKDKRYVPVYIDSYSIVFVKNNPENQKLINAHQVSLNNIVPKSDGEIIRYIDFFQKIGRYDLAKKYMVPLNRIRLHWF